MTATPAIDKEALRAKYLAERDKRLRPDGNDQYLRLAGTSLAHYLSDPYMPVVEREPLTDHVTVALIGGGFAGLITGARLREAGIDDEHCDKLEELTTNIYMSCSFQDLTGQRTQKVVHVLRYLENRVNAMIRIWHIDADDIEKVTPDPIRPDDTRPDAHLLHGPQPLLSEH